MQKQSIFLLLIILFGAQACSNIETINEKLADGMTTTFERDAKTKLKQGKFTRFYTNGKIAEQATYKQDSLEGERKFFYENGTLQTIENYKNGRYHGAFTQYGEDGKIEQEGNYQNNEMTGQLKTYYEGSTQLKEIVEMKHNEENGPFKEYYDNGTLKAEGSYLEGEIPHGELKEYHKSGELMRIANCDHGRCTTTFAADTTQFKNR